PRKQRTAATSIPATTRYDARPATAYSAPAIASPPMPIMRSSPAWREISDRPANTPRASRRIPLISRRRFWRPVPRVDSEGGVLAGICVLGFGGGITPTSEYLARHPSNFLPVARATSWNYTDSTRLPRTLLGRRTFGESRFDRLLFRVGLFGGGLFGGGLGLGDAGLEGLLGPVGEDGLGGGAGHAGDGRHFIDGRFAHALDAAEVAQQHALAAGADAGDGRERGPQRQPPALAAVEADREPVRLVAQRLQHEHLGAAGADRDRVLRVRQEDAIGVLRPVLVLRALRGLRLRRLRRLGRRGRRRDGFGAVRRRRRRRGLRPRRPAPRSRGH